MSRIGKHPVELQGTKAVINAGVLEVTGPKGTLKQKIHSEVEVSVEGDKIVVQPKNDNKLSNSLWGTYRQVISSMVHGTKEGFKKVLDVNGVGFRVAVKGDLLILTLGFSHPIYYVAPQGISFVSPKQTQVEVHGFDKQLVGQVAAEIRSFRKPEPYKGKGVKYDNEKVRRKEGKKK